MMGARFGIFLFLPKQQLKNIFYTIDENAYLFLGM